jgi:two-component system LytT family sensor kinase
MNTQQGQAAKKPFPIRRVYWVCQAAGWSALFLLQMAGAYVLRMSPNPPLSRVMIALAVFCTMGVIVTHGMYLVIRRRRWLQMPMRQLWPRLAISVALATAPLTGTTIIANLSFVHTFPEDHLLHPRTFIVIWANHMVILVLWMALYLAVNEFRRRRLAEVNALRLELVAQEAQLRGLRAQLNPHFLFNCLNSLREMIVENPEDAQKMVTQLSGLLRYSLQSNHTELVALTDEVRAVKDYLDLEAVRFEDRLQVHWNVASEAGAAAVPPMLLQTLVENALKHGIGRRSEGGEIAITVQSQDSLIHLEVINSGSLPESPSPNGIGLKNARTRLQLLYGEKGNIVLESIPENRVRVAVTLPFMAMEGSQ